MSSLRVGSAVLPLIPPLDIDMAGFVNRTISGRGYGEPMEVGAVVAENDGNRVAVVSMDVALIPLNKSNEIRDKIAKAVGCPSSSVLINVNHSHALPSFYGDYKLGGQYSEVTAKEKMFADYAVEMAVSAACLASHRLEEAVMILGVSEVKGISVNRRERTEDGRTILGWNPDGVCDRSVQTACFQRHDRSVIATMVNFACHPVIVGKEIPEYSSDYVGPIRKTVKNMLGGDCLFLQGAAGNILPLEAFLEMKGKEVEFGKKVGMQAVQSLMDPIEPDETIEKLNFGSVTPISLYRKQKNFTNHFPVIANEERVSFPFEELPTREQLVEEIAKRSQEIAQIKAQQQPLSLINPIRYHLEWAKLILRKMDDGTLKNHIEAPLQAIRIGNLGISAAPGEIFNEIGLAVKAKSKAKVTFYCGYSNGLIGYFATAAEYPYKGYEPFISHRGFGMPAPFDPTCEEILIHQGSALLNELFR